MAEHGREVELKLRMTPAEVPALLAHPRIEALGQGRPRTRRLRSVYFDTQDQDLARLGIALRVRFEGRTRRQAFKARGSTVAGLFDRVECESPIDADEPDLALLPDPALRAELVRALEGKRLEPIFETAVRRTTRRLRDGGHEAVLDLDQGEIVCGERRAPICELELEVEKGDPAWLYDLALELAGTIDLRIEPRDKAERGWALYTEESPRPRKAERVELARDATLGRALAAVVGGCLQQILANEAAVLEGRDPEGIHQMRVGVRRLRSALGLVRSCGSPEEVEPLLEGLRWLGGVLGAARDLDVLLAGLLEPLAARDASDPALQRLCEAAREARAETQERVREALGSPRFGGLGLELGRWLAREGQREEGEAGAELRRPAREWAATLLERRHRKARRLGRDLEEASSRERHRLRIQLKKLRYAAEFFRSLYGGQRAERYIAHLADLQDVLGELNDATTADRVLGALLSRLEPAPVYFHAAGLASGWKAHSAERRSRRLLKLWKAFEDATPFWRS
jgi:inorganic triphosphatase YgiF